MSAIGPSGQMVPVAPMGLDATSQALDSLRASVSTLDPAERERARLLVRTNSTNSSLSGAERVILARVEDVLVAVAADTGRANQRRARQIIAEACNGRVIFTALEETGLLADLPLLPDGSLDGHDFRSLVEDEVRCRVEAPGFQYGDRVDQ